MCIRVLLCVGLLLGLDCATPAGPSPGPDRFDYGTPERNALEGVLCIAGPVMCLLRVLGAVD